MMDKDTVRFLLRRHLPRPLDPETLTVLMAAVDEVAEEHPDPEDWYEGTWDLLADGTGLLDLIEDEEEGPETDRLTEAVTAAARALTEALFPPQA